MLEIYGRPSSASCSAKVWCQISAVETTCEDDPNGLSDVVSYVRRMGWNYNAILFGLGLARRVAMSDAIWHHVASPSQVFWRSPTSRPAANVECVKVGRDGAALRQIMFTWLKGTIFFRKRWSFTKSSPCKGVGDIAGPNVAYGILWLCQKCRFVSIPKPGWSQLTNRFGDGWRPPRDPRWSSTLWS